MISTNQIKVSLWKWTNESHLVPLESVQESDADHGRPDARHVSESSEDQRLHLHVLHPGLGYGLNQTQPV